MTTPAIGVLGDDERRRQLAAVAMGAITAVAMIGGGFRSLDLALLPWPAVLFAARLRWPSLPMLMPAVAALVFPVALNLADDDNDVSMFITIVAVLVVAIDATHRRAAHVYLAVVIGAVATLGLTGTVAWGWANWIVGILLTWGFGVALRAYEQLVLELRATQARMIDQATLVERRRIARDVHDLVGHSLSVVTLHVAGARRVVRTDPDEAEAALLQAEEAARSSMVEVRRSVGLMRDTGDGESSAPAPDLTDIEAIVEQYRGAGLRVEFHADGPITEVDGPPAVACCRIAQEALANVVKHTIGASALAELEVDDDTCRLRVTDHGGAAASPGGEAVGPGHGLIGMRERALSVGGSLVAGPTADGWTVDLTVPRDPASARRNVS